MPEDFPSPSEARYHALFNAIDEGFCVIEFLDGPHGKLSDYVHIEANPAYARCCWRCRGTRPRPRTMARTR